MTKHTVEVFVAMNEDGDYEVGMDADEAKQNLEDNQGGDFCRVVKINVTMSAPEIVEASVKVGDEAGEVAAI